MKNLLFALPFFLFAFSCSEPESAVVTTVNIKGERIPKINIDAVPFELHQIGISELISDYKVIPLETKKECLVSNTRIACYDNMLLIGTQHFPDPAPVYQFDMDGRFIKEIGKAGNGPGEHNNYLVSSIQILPEKRLIKINFGTQIQLFDYNGEYIEEIEQPYDFMGDAFYLSDGKWFSPGSAAGPPNYARDSVIIVIHDMEGSIMHKIPRLIYPTGIGYTPTSWRPSVYRYNDNWNLYMPGLDTIFSMYNTELEVATILDLGQKRQA